MDCIHQIPLSEPCSRCELPHGTEEPTEPGIVRVGEWAHVRWGGHHKVVADEPEVDDIQPVRVACGKRFERSRIWHDAPEPHLPQCKACAAVERRGIADRRRAAMRRLNAR